MERGRRIAAHEGYVDDSHFDKVMGGAGTDIGSAVRLLFSTVQSDIFGQMYGASSWILKHVKGKWSSIEFQIMIHNLYVQSRVHQFAVPGETVPGIRPTSGQEHCLS